jgi:hypothetical protein
MDRHVVKPQERDCANVFGFKRNLKATILAGSHLTKAPYIIRYQFLRTYK